MPRKNNDQKLATYEMLDNLCQKQHQYIVQRDAMLDKILNYNSSLSKSNTNTILRIRELEEQIKNQEDNFKIVANEMILMWNELEKCGGHESFLNEKITTNIEELEAKFKMKH